MIQSSNGERAFDRIFTNRVVSIGYLKNVELAYTVQIIGAANKFADGVLSSQDALAAIKSATDEICDDVAPLYELCSRTTWTSNWPARPESLMKSADTQVADAHRRCFSAAIARRIRKFIASNWYAAADPLSDQLDQLYQTLQSEARNDFQDLTTSYARGANDPAFDHRGRAGGFAVHRLDRLARRHAFAWATFAISSMNLPPARAI